VGACLLFAYFHYAWRDTTPVGPLNSVTDWPKPVQDIYHSIDAAGLPTEQFQVCLLHGQPGWTDCTVICRAPLTDQLLELISSQLGLQTIPTSDATTVGSRVKSRVSGWWPNASNGVAYLACSNSLAGEEGPLYVVAVDSPSAKLYIHYYFNF
jgi:hypothetical protein